MSEPRFEPYCRARRKIHGGDLLLFRQRGIVWRVVGVAGRSPYTHAAMAGWWRRRLMCVEMTAGGGRAVLLSHYVRRWPGKIDVYQAGGRRPETGDQRKNPPPSSLPPPASSLQPPASRLRFDRAAALRAMIDITGRRYGWFNLLRAAMLHLPIWRFLVPAETDDAAADGRPPFCSQAVAAACRAGGVDPVPNLADRLTEPGDLARSSFFQYEFALV